VVLGAAKVERTEAGRIVRRRWFGCLVGARREARKERYLDSPVVVQPTILITKFSINLRLQKRLSWSALLNEYEFSLYSPWHCGFCSHNSQIPESLPLTSWELNRYERSNIPMLPVIGVFQPHNAMSHYPIISMPTKLSTTNLLRPSCLLCPSSLLRLKN
jgi:hypothetical protein